MDYREYELIRRLDIYSHLKSEELCDHVGLGKNQLDYNIKLINEKLADMHLPLIKKDSHDRVVIDSKVLSRLNNLWHEGKIQFPYADKELRMDTLFLMIAGYQGEWLSLEYLSQVLSVSKNTIVKDITELRKEIHPQSIKIINNRKYGYYMIGDEWLIRSEVFRRVNRLDSAFLSERDIGKMLKISDEQFHWSNNFIDEMEFVLNVRFADRQVRQTSLILNVFQKRLQYKNLKMNQEVNIQEFHSIRDYQKITKVVTKHVPDLSEEELFYFVIYFKSLTIRSVRDIEPVQEDKLRSAVEEFIDKFEDYAVVMLRQKETLINKLYLHLSTAYYRIRYQLSASNLNIDANFREYDYIVDAVSKSIMPLEEIFESEIPRNEIYYIVAFLLGHISLEEKMETIGLPRAIVVCENGVIYSTIMENEIKRYVPEIKFEGRLSVRQFLENKDSYLEYDYIFSSSPKLIGYGENIIYIEDIALLNADWLERKMEKNQHNIDSRLMIRDLQKIIFEDDQIDSKTREYLMDKFQVIAHQFSNFEEEESKPLEIIDHVFIKRLENSMSWEDILKTASQVLLEKDYINDDYLPLILERLPYPKENILLGGTIFIPHVSYEDGVKHWGASFMKLDKALLWKEREIFFVCLIAPDASGRHMPFVELLYKISRDEAILSALKEEKDEKEILKSLSYLMD